MCNYAALSPPGTTDREHHQATRDSAHRDVPLRRLSVAMASLIAVLSALLALAGRAAGHITFSPNTGAHPCSALRLLLRRRLTRFTPRRAVVKAPYFTTQMVIGHGSAGQSTQVISIQTPYGVKVTPEQKPGAFSRWALVAAPAGSRRLRAHAPQGGT